MVNADSLVELFGDFGFEITSEIVAKCEFYIPFSASLLQIAYLSLKVWIYVLLII